MTFRRKELFSKPLMFNRFPISNQKFSSTEEFTGNYFKTREQKRIHRQENCINIGGWTGKKTTYCIYFDVFNMYNLNPLVKVTHSDGQLHSFDDFWKQTVVKQQLLLVSANLVITTRRIPSLFKMCSKAQRTCFDNQILNVRQIQRNLNISVR